MQNLLHSLYPNFAYFGHAAGECKTFFVLLFLRSNGKFSIWTDPGPFYVRMESFTLERKNKKEQKI